MNKKLRELLDKINAKKEEVKTLAESGKIDEAKAAKDELQKLQDEFDILKDVEDEPTGEINHAVPVAQKTDPVHDFADAARHGFKNASSNEGTGADGGYTVPTDIMTLVNQYKEAKFDLSTLVDVETVMTNTGRRTYQTHAQHKRHTHSTRDFPLSARAQRSDRLPDRSSRCWSTRSRSMPDICR